MTGRDLRLASRSHPAAGRPVDDDQAPSLGCNIKWKPGTSPATSDKGHSPFSYKLQGRTGTILFFRQSSPGYRFDRKKRMVPEKTRN